MPTPPKMNVFMEQPVSSEYKFVYTDLGGVLILEHFRECFRTPFCYD